MDNIYNIVKLDYASLYQDVMIVYDSKKERDRLRKLKNKERIGKLERINGLWN